VITLQIADSSSRQRGSPTDTRQQLSQNNLRTESNICSQIPVSARYLDIMTDLTVSCNVTSTSIRASKGEGHNFGETVDENRVPCSTCLYFETQLRDVLSEQVAATVTLKAELPLSNLRIDPACTEFSSIISDEYSFLLPNPFHSHRNLPHAAI
jgi:hypothetical protein